MLTGERGWCGWKHSHFPGGLDQWPLTLSKQYSLLSKKDKLQNTNLTFPQTVLIDDAQKISRLNAPGFNGLEIGLKRKKHQIKGNQGEPAKNPPMLKLVFSLELKNSNFRSGRNLLSFDMDEI